MTETFPYRAKSGRMLLAAVFFGAAAAFFLHRAATNERGLIINGLIELGRSGASVFFAVLGGLSAAFVLAAAVAVVLGRIRQPVLTLGDDHLLVPQGFFQGRMRRVEFATITAVQVQEINRQQFLRIRTTAGNVAIARSLLHPEAAFDRIAAALSRPLDAARS